MKQWTEEELINDGNRLRNAEITNVSLNFKDHGVLTLASLFLAVDGELYSEDMF